MINKDRIVPIIKTDWLTAVGTMLAIANVSYGVVAASNVEGDFSVTGSGAAGNKLLNQPARAIDFTSGVTSATVYFVAGFDYKGFTKNGSALTNSGDVIKDGVTLYKGVLSSSTVTITAVSPVAS